MRGMVGLVSGELGGAWPRGVCAVARGASRSARRFRPRRLFLAVTNGGGRSWFLVEAFEHARRDGQHNKPCRSTLWRRLSSFSAGLGSRLPCAGKGGGMLWETARLTSHPQRRTKCRATVWRRLSFSAGRGSRPCARSVLWTRSKQHSASRTRWQPTSLLSDCKSYSAGAKHASS